MGIFQKWPLEENVEFSLIGTKFSSSHVTMQELCGSESDVKKIDRSERGLGSVTLLLLCRLFWGCFLTWGSFLPEIRGTWLECVGWGGYGGYYWRLIVYQLSWQPCLFGFKFLSFPDLKESSRVTLKTKDQEFY